LIRDSSGGRGCAGTVRVCWLSDIGRERENNEDACLSRPEDGLLAVADGMGGEHGGEVAAQCVIESLPAIVAEHMASCRDGRVEERECALRDAVCALNHALRDEISSLGAPVRMGTTLTMAFIIGDCAHIAQMGDSRCYMLREGALERLTQDHSVVGMLLDRGAITEDQAVGHPMQGQLMRYVGMGGGAKPEIRTVEFREGDRLLLCTDGLTNAVDDDSIRDLLCSAEDIDEACGMLVQAANDAGGRDNVTVLLAERLAEGAAQG
jgi:protein phosphatase